MSSEAMNEKLAKYLPELAESSYGEYPLHHKRWLDPGERGPSGEPCFIPATQDGGVKKHYVWGKGPNGMGYYHLLTRPAYQNLYRTIAHKPPNSRCCACSAAARKELDEWDDVRRIMYNRTVSPVPDDNVAQQAAIAKAQGTAQAWHNGLQNEQLLVIGVNQL